MRVMKTAAGEEETTEKLSPCLLNTGKGRLGQPGRPGRQRRRGGGGRGGREEEENMHKCDFFFDD